MAEIAKIPSFDLTRNYVRVKEEVNVAVRRVLDTQHFILGPEVEALERELASYLEVKNTIGCASGTDSLILAMMTLNLEPGDEVITTPFTFFATASCITRNGGTPVFADVDPFTYNIKSEEVLSKLTPRTRAVLPVHLFGQMCPLEEIKDELKSRGVVLIEDCAQSIGAHRMIEGRVARSGSVGDMGCFSFFPTKNLGCYGDGGLVSVACDEDLASRIKRLRVHGAGDTYFHEEVGINSRLDALQAAILRVRLRHLEGWNEERRIVAERYAELFAENDLLESVTLPAEAKGGFHVFHQYVVRAKRRDELQKFLAARGVTTRVYYPLPLHLQHCFSYLGYKKGDFPVAEMLADEVLALPMFPELLPEEQQCVVSEIADFYRGA
ncbi:DegT/DnrJ/EryC1/StrS family aminotransferase [Synergistes jonesii]|uniref:Pleiotropic regulatory protein n=1 Tax=Synergistes jonesii TaxID=2754 RepID=A0A073J3N1_9BACT|nr:DegT/DnrJ/EryC1/StrS family aminotransferase [Synergistes jonesii]KEJ92342.1 Pleiotropic regulatory protein [Synergistes jonesii]OFB62786.1 Pleiotropic regulatory protein [Synergistes jonesii]OFB63493.1 Pleiotropic regulatory protein [Synergistes jonesii]OFB65464.1 Pleiotropic regulatory protein [Synergistes jonesii]OFB67731.1 Pleiotropic regulatory protein [Synergistes jonesii]